LTLPDEIFLTRRKKMEKFIQDFWDKFSKPKPKLTEPTQPEQQKIDQTWDKNF